jgi:hypothetical protein
VNASTETIEDAARRLISRVPETDLAARLAATSDQRAKAIRGLAVALTNNVATVQASMSLSRPSPSGLIAGPFFAARYAVGINGYMNADEAEAAICRALGLT